jgi:transcriptional accessory protein Tex/SPT6
VLEFTQDFADDMRFIYKMQDRARDPKTNYVQLRHIEASFEIMSQLLDTIKDIRHTMEEKGINTNELLDQHTNMLISDICSEEVKNDTFSR